MPTATLEKTTNRHYIFDIALDRIMNNVQYNCGPNGPRANLPFKTGHGIETIGLHIKKAEPQLDGSLLIEGTLDTGESFVGSYDPEQSAGYIDATKR